MAEVDLEQIELTQSQLLATHFNNIEHHRQIPENHIVEIVELFGGIDTVLTHLLSTSMCELGQIGIKQLQTILHSIPDSDGNYTIGSPTLTIGSPTLTATGTLEVINDHNTYPVNTTASNTRMSSEQVMNNLCKEVMNGIFDDNEKPPMRPMARPPLNPLTINSMSFESITRKQRSGTIHDKDQPIEWRYCFSRNNTFIHSIFGEINGQKVFDILYSKWAIVIIFLFCFLVPFGFENMRIVPTNDVIQGIYFGVIVPIQILYFIFHLLSVNKKCFFLIVKRFEFWFKMFYGTQFVIGNFLYWNISPGMAILLGIVTSLSIMLLSLSDGLQFRVSMKIVFGVTVSLYYTVIAGYYLLYYQYEEDGSGSSNNDMVWEITDQMSISLISVLTQSSQILALFFWRTTIMSIIDQKRCTLITYSPFLKWERDVARCGSHLVYNNY